MSARQPHELLLAAQQSAPAAPVEIAGVQLVPIEYNGARVLTLAMMDAVHQRPKDTARRNFNEHKKRLIEGEDFSKVCADEIRTHKIFPISNMAHEDVIMLTETGYSMLVKSFTDDLAWDVQRQLVKSYFAKPAPVAKPRRARTALSSSLADARAIDFIGNMVAKVPGARADVVAAIKLRMIEDHTGLPATLFGSALPVEALEKAVKLNPTEIGRRFAPKLSPIRINTILIDLGLQRKSESGYVLTEAGAAHGESRPFQADNHHVGDQINWYESVVEVAREAVRGAGGQLQLITS